ncbi:MAG: LPS export ABC transporter periplasmic protein LptC [Ignavibacteriaceae bacterium]|nr:LPS export ABC transporter periplasmic protein LptC [Ignavibacteriaceae bacterium]NUM69665.1 LPS export ABC transporter periplasmic protein LptC [Ignavibacteriaceae bacterium]
MKKSLTVFILLAVVYLTGCSEEKVKPPVKSINLSEAPSQESWNSTITFTDSGKIQAIVTTGHIRIFTTGAYTLLDSSVQVDFHDEKEVKTTTLTSKWAKVDDRTKDIYAFRDVKVVNDSGMVLETEMLMWRNSDGKIVSDKFVKIDTKEEQIEGYGFESDQALRNYKIFKVTLVTVSTKLD